MLLAQVALKTRPIPTRIGGGFFFRYFHSTRPETAEKGRFVSSRNDLRRLLNNDSFTFLIFLCLFFNLLKIASPWHLRASNHLPTWSDFKLFRASPIDNLLSKLENAKKKVKARPKIFRSGFKSLRKSGAL
jgi:hypothetical protein